MFGRFDGMGKLRIVRNGLRLEGNAEFMHGLYATEIKARQDHSMKIESARNLTLNARNVDADISTQLFLGDQKLEVFASKFTVTNSSGAQIFSANDSEVTVGAEILKVTGIGGAVFTGAVETSEIQSDYRSDLKLESPTRNLDFDGAQGIKMESNSGEIQASSMMDLKLQSRKGIVKLDSRKIYFHVSKLPEMKTTQNSKDTTVRAYQLCVCETGRLFLAHPKEKCTTDGYFC
uniref:Uncharacterized protein n=1 Tax=Strigamia maritima TaxID=126957 RepID=T1ISK8_STRMM